MKQKESIAVTKILIEHFRKELRGQKVNFFKHSSNYVIPKGQNSRTGYNLTWHDPKTCPVWMDSMDHRLHP